MKSTAASSNTPEVSTTKGTKWWLVSRCAYSIFNILNSVNFQSGEHISKHELESGTLVVNKCPYL